MTDPMTNDWTAANTRYLAARLAVVRERLTAFCSEQTGGDDGQGDDVPDTTGRADTLEQNAFEIVNGISERVALDELCNGFELSPFERDILLMCLGIELDPDFAHLCATAQGNAQATFPTFRLALAALPDMHWSAVTPVGPLRHWRLIEVESGSSLTTSPLRIDERVLHYLVGTSYLDQFDRLKLLQFSTPMLFRLRHS